MRKPAAKVYVDTRPAESAGFEYLRNKLKLKQYESKRNFSQRYPHADKFLKEKGLDLGKIREHSAKIVGAGALAGSLIFSAPSGFASLPSPQEIIEKLKSGEENIKPQLPQKILVDSLLEILPPKPEPLPENSEKLLEQIFANVMGIKAKAALEGEHLNTTYGLIGIEQHLRRYPGDRLGEHGTGETLEEGIAPGLGGFGYFAQSKEELTPSLVETEKWYAVAQLMYLPDWEKRLRYLIDWYKFRKVLIVNTQNGNAVVGAIADAGPAAWTGKHFGGSPEVMEYLGGQSYKKGPVIMFFVDDPENQVPLGPLEYNEIKLQNLVES